MTYDEFLSELYALRDEKYREFSLRIVKTKREFIGVRTPALRKLAKRVKRECPDFIGGFFGRESATHEEVLVAGWQTGKDYGENVALLTRLIPLMDSWAQTDQTICDFKWAKDKERLIADFSHLKAGGEFERRAFVILLMTNCMTEDAFGIIERELPTVRTGEYYVDMAVAWLLCEAVVRFPERGRALLGMPFVTPSVAAKTRGKLRDSFRVK